MPARLEGALDFSSMPIWLPRAKALASQHCVDLSGLTRVDSCGVSYLLELSRRAAAGGSRLRFTGPPRKLLSLLQFLKVDTVLDIER